MGLRHTIPHHLSNLKSLPLRYLILSKSFFFSLLKWLIFFKVIYDNEKRFVINILASYNALPKSFHKVIYGYFWNRVIPTTSPFLSLHSNIKYDLLSRRNIKDVIMTSNNVLSISKKIIRLIYDIEISIKTYHDKGCCLKILICRPHKEFL